MALFGLKRWHHAVALLLILPRAGVLLAGLKGIPLLILHVIIIYAVVVGIVEGVRWLRSDEALADVTEPN